MTATTKLLTFEDYLHYDDGTDNCYELVDGRLAVMPPESLPNYLTADYLADMFKRLVGRSRVSVHALELAVPEVSGLPRNRKPHLTVLREEHVEQIRALGKLAITDDMLPPLLVVEVVSPGARNRERDYVHKYLQYQLRGVPEYWIVDPQEKVVTVLQLTEEEGDRVYLPNAYRENDVVRSPSFPAFQLTAQQVLNPPL